MVLFHLKSSFRSQHIQIFVFLSFPLFLPVRMVKPHETPAPSSMRLQILANLTATGFLINRRNMNDGESLIQEISFSSALIHQAHQYFCFQYKLRN